MLSVRFAAQLLTGPPAADPVAVAERLLAIQAQDLRGARLAIRARSCGLTAADVDNALASRALVITWLNRGTLHLVRSEDYWWLHGLTTPLLFAGVSKRLAREGVPPSEADRAVAVIEAALAADGPLTRHQIAAFLTRQNVRAEGQALIFLLALASLRGITVRGPVAAGTQRYVLVRDWLGTPSGAFDRDRALAELARRYLAGHGPASERDLSKWAGLPLRDARRGLTAIAAELADRSDGLACLAGRPDVGQIPPPKLLGSFDPLLHGWVSREPVLGDRQAMITAGGLFRPFALVAGRAAGTWKLDGGQVVLTPFQPLGDAEADELRSESADVVRFLGLSPEPA
jgi:hypothetical protein